MASRDRRVESMRELRRLVPAILKEINADPALALRAAANPLLAVEELGYALAPGVRAEAERRVRFPKATRERMAVLEKEIFEHAAERFDLDSPPALEHVLFEKLKLERPGATPDTATQAAPRAPQPASFVARMTAALGRDRVDPMEALDGKHPIMRPLLEYRRLDASEPGLASPELYERIRRGEAKLPLVRIRARLKTESQNGEVA